MVTASTKADQRTGGRQMRPIGRRISLIKLSLVRVPWKILRDCQYGSFEGDGLETRSTSDADVETSAFSESNRRGAVCPLMLERSRV